MTEEPSQDGFPIGKVLKAGVGFGVAVVLLYLIGVAAGWEKAVENLRGAHLGWVAVACLSTVFCFCVWTLMWRYILAAMDVSVGYGHLVVTFFGASFANYVTPMGQAGGEPLIAYIISRDTRASYEQGLASVLTADVIRLLPFFNAAGVGLAYLLFDAGLPVEIRGIVVFLAALAVSLPALIYAGWRYRNGVREKILGAVKPLSRRTERFSVEEVGERIDRLYDSVGLVADSKKTILVSVGLAYVGWILFALPLYFSGIALGVHVSFLLVCFLVPATVVVSFVPLPGGLGAIEGTLVVLLVALVSISSSEALALTAVYRLASYWIVVVAGGIAALWVVVRV